MIEQGILNEIASLLKGSLDQQLEIPRRSTTYGSPGKPGLPKPVSGRYPTPISPPIASGNLIRNIDVMFIENPQTGIPELVMEMPIEGFFVNEGRRPGRYPPVGPIDKWVRQKQSVKGIRDAKGRFIPRKTLVYLIRRSIGQYGYGGNDFINKAYDKIQQQVLEKYGDYVAGYLQFQIEQFIDKLRTT
jgi:hypothetical protein